MVSVGLGKSTKCFLCMDEKLAEGSIFLDATRGPLEHVTNTVVACESEKYIIRRRALTITGKTGGGESHAEAMEEDGSEEEEEPHAEPEHFVDSSLESESDDPERGGRARAASGGRRIKRPAMITASSVSRGHNLCHVTYRSAYLYHLYHPPAWPATSAPGTQPVPRHAQHLSYKAERTKNARCRVRRTFIRHAPQP